MTINDAKSAASRALLATMLAASATWVATMAGCGGSDKVEVTADNTTLGKELEDLDKAYRDGLLTEDEYKKARKRVLEGE